MNPFYSYMPTSNPTGFGFINGSSVSPKTTLLNNKNINNNGVNGFGNQIINISKENNHVNSLSALQ